MKISALIVLVAAGAVFAASGQVVEDATGRRVKLPAPDKIKKVYPAGPPAAVLMFTLAPEKLVGLPLAFDATAKAMVPAAYRNLPKTGRLSGRGSTANVEEVLKVGTDLVLDLGSVAGSSHALARETADKTGLPTLLMDGSFDKLPATYRTLGRALGVPERGEKLAVYIEKTLAEVEAALAKAPAGKRPRVYYGRGPKGLETAAAGSINAEAFERARLENVSSAAGPKGSVVPVSPEDLLVWKPDAIITIEDAAYDAITTNPVFAGLDAVKSKKVYAAPTKPFGWVDYPPSVNRLLGLQWLVRMFHPGVLPDDLKARVAEFHELFYQQALTPEQLEALVRPLAH